MRTCHIEVKGFEKYKAFACDTRFNTIKCSNENRYKSSDII